MPANEKNVTKVLSALSHPLRREILVHLDEEGECSFTDLMHFLKTDTGKLSFHIRSLSPFTEQTATGKYKLNKVGENAIKLIKELEYWAGETEVAEKESVLPIASFKKRAYSFLVDFFLMLGITVAIALPNSFSSLIVGNAFNLDFSLIVLVTLTLLWVYLTLLEGFNGQSLGERILGVRVVRVDGKSLSYDYVAVRNFGKTFLLPFDL